MRNCCLFVALLFTNSAFLGHGQETQLAHGTYASSTFTFSPDGNLVAVVAGRRAMLFDSATGEYRTSFRYAPPELDQLSAAGVAFSRDGTTIFVAAPEARIVGWNIEARQKTHSIWEPWIVTDPQDLVPFDIPLFTCFALAPDEKSVAVGLIDGTVHEWELQTGKHVGVFGQSIAEFGRVEVAEKEIAQWVKQQLAKQVGEARRRAVDHIVLYKIDANRTQQVRSLAYSADGTSVFARLSGAIRVYDRDTRVERLRIQGSRFAIFEDSKTIAVMTDDGVRLCDVASGDVMRHIPYPSFPYGVHPPLVLKSNGDLVSCMSDGIVRVWNAGSRRILLGRRVTEEIYATTPMRLTLSTDGKKVAILRRGKLKVVALPGN